MMGGVPNYFHPVGVLHSAWTDRAERSARFAMRVMEYVEKKACRTVAVRRQHIGRAPVLSSGYITRHPEVPRTHGTFELPSLDNWLRYRFSPRAFRFERSGQNRGEVAQLASLLAPA